MQLMKNSKIEKTIGSDGATILSWKNPNGGLIRFFYLGFLCVWMAGWTAGGIAVLSGLLTGTNEAKAFSALWLVGWAIGWITVAAILYMSFRPQHSESLTFKGSRFDYDSGTLHPLAVMSLKTYTMPMEFFRKFYKRKKLQNLNLTDTDIRMDSNPSRLYFDHNSERIEIGRFLAEPEVEWLYQYVQNKR